MKVRFYNTSNSWWYLGKSFLKGHWLSLYGLGKCITFYWGPGTKYIPPTDWKMFFNLK